MIPYTPVLPVRADSHKHYLLAWERLIACAESLPIPCICKDDFQGLYCVSPSVA